MMDYEYESDNRRSAISSDAYLKELNAKTLRKRYDALEEASRSNTLPSNLATPKLKAFIDEIALQTALPKNIALCTALNQLALTAQGAYRLQLDRGRSPVPLSLWFLIEMASGEGKSPLADQMQRLVEPVFGEAQLRFESAMAKYSAKHSVWTNIKSGLESALRKAVKKGDLQGVCFSGYQNPASREPPCRFKSRRFGPISMQWRARKSLIAWLVVFSVRKREASLL